MREPFKLICMVVDMCFRKPRKHSSKVRSRFADLYLLAHLMNVVLLDVSLAKASKLAYNAYMHASQ